MTATTAPPRQRAGNRGGLLVLAGVVVAAALLAGSTLLLRAPATVDVRVQNDSSAPVLVTVSGRDGSSVLLLGTVPARGSTQLREVLDQGDEWHFSLRVGPDEVGELHRSRAQLEASGWTVTVPARVATGEHPGDG